jgi:hypothetical protein
LPSRGTDDIKADHHQLLRKNRLAANLNFWRCRRTIRWVIDSDLIIMILLALVIHGRKIRNPRISGGEFEIVDGQCESPASGCQRRTGSTSCLQHSVSVITRTPGRATMLTTARDRDQTSTSNVGSFHDGILIFPWLTRPCNSSRSRV